ncbi:MAG: undecaprenyl-diphosphate phosphatase [Lachnospiraceae bacterium]|nr:undecaprenyl-diphosphate phosphatase [Lachnospiraceae bacterium]
MTDILKAVLYGIVEGITEWLPVSSTGHMILLNEFVKMKQSEEFFSMFLVVIQLGAILAVVILFWNKLWPFAKADKNTDPIKDTGILKVFVKKRWIMWAKILIACVPAAIVGVLFDDELDALFYNPTCVAVALIVFGIAFIVVESLNLKNADADMTIDDITYRQALVIGCWQLIAAIFPGTSRSGSTIIGSLLIGVSRSAAAEFTFLLAVPVMLGASLLKIVKFGFHFSGLEAAVLLTGMLTAFVVSILIIRFLLGYIRKHNFKVFGYYRIVLGLAVFGYFAFR